MACASCGNKENGVPAGCKSNGSCGNGGCDKLTVFNWLSNMDQPDGKGTYPAVEVRFKNGRKEFFSFDPEHMTLYEGEAVVVDMTKGYDIGIVSLSGELVRLQIQKKHLVQNFDAFSKVLRKATEKDLELWENGKAKEAQTMVRSREIARDLNLAMKISDVEYQADQSKVIFYYTAEERVDFRELIRKLADAFKTRIEMKQIGMRQEAGRLGGIGSCGRELCCSTWLTDFRSVSTSAARYQQLSLNPSKLAGQCGKLKCCLNYELDLYVEELKEFPNTKHKLKTEKGNAFFQKMDIFKKRMWYSYADQPNEFIEMSLEQVKGIIDDNKKGKKVLALRSESSVMEVEKTEDYANVVGQDSLNRFDHLKGGKKKGRNKKRRKSRKQDQKQNNQKGN
ncbi:MAG: hypothetical protein CMP59_08995 [Flavobacteriales bacterium]|nr:hypothetical protein [Flavobacteriales bacterium]